MKEEDLAVRTTALKRMLITVWALPLVGVVFFLGKPFQYGHALLKYVLIGTAVACVPFLRDLLELVTGVRFKTMATNWDGLKGWQRGVIGFGVVLGVFFLFTVIVTQIVYPEGQPLSPDTHVKEASPVKKFKLKASDIKPVAEGYGACYASDHITVEGRKVGYMYREEPDNDSDSGWRFLSGEESQEYLDNPDNLAIYDVNTIANYDPAIVEYLSAEVGSAYARSENGRFVPEEPPVK